MLVVTANDSMIQKRKCHLRIVVICAVLFPLWSHQDVLAQTAWTGCGPSQTTHQVMGHATQLLRGIERVPRNAIRPENLKWELPIAAATGLLIAEAEQPAAHRVPSPSVQNL